LQLVKKLLPAMKTLAGSGPSEIFFWKREYPGGINLLTDQSVIFLE